MLYSAQAAYYKMAERLSRGNRKYIRDLKPEARGALNETQAWEMVDKVLSTRVEDYPEKYGQNLSVIRGFHRLRWEYRYSPPNLLGEALNNFMEENPPEVLDELKPVFGVIAQVYSKP